MFSTGFDGSLDGLDVAPNRLEVRVVERLLLIAAKQPEILRASA